MLKSSQSRVEHASASETVMTAQVDGLKVIWGVLLEAAVARDAQDWGADAAAALAQQVCFSSFAA
jgi:hypothetical protein